MAETLTAESLTRVLYPDDPQARGRGCASCRSISWWPARWPISCAASVAATPIGARSPKGCHPAQRYPSDAGGPRIDAHSAGRRASRLGPGLGPHATNPGYTNHTLLPEALEKWPLAWFDVLPRQLEIIYEINRRLLDDVRSRFPGDEGRVARVSLIEEGPTKHVRMANLAIVGSHSTNGVAAIHSGLLRTMTVKDLAEMFPERFNNKTNGVTPRRWLLLANPALARTITEAIGDGWITDLSQLRQLKPLADDRGFRDAFRQAKREAKTQFADWLQRTSARRWTRTPFRLPGQRIHEYKRQLLNALRIVVLYNRLRQNPNLEMPPRTFIFAGKAAPAYQLAKLIIKFINNLAGTSTVTQRCAADSRSVSARL